MPRQLVVFVEEYSMEAALGILLPKMLGDMEFQIIRFQCKDDLLKNLPRRLRGYRHWLPQDWSILVLVDRDADDCAELKRQLEDHARAAGFQTKTMSASGQHFEVTNRIVIEELESWYFGDWSAVQSAYPRVNSRIPQQAPYRNPDDIKGGTCEALERILVRAGYFSTGLRKVECAREIAQCMDLQQNRSHSFNVFSKAIQTILAGSIA